MYLLSRHYNKQFNQIYLSIHMIISSFSKSHFKFKNFYNKQKEVAYIFIMNHFCIIKVYSSKIETTSFFKISMIQLALNSLSV